MTHETIRNINNSTIFLNTNANINKVLFRDTESLKLISHLKLCHGWIFLIAINWKTQITK